MSFFLRSITEYEGHYLLRHLYLAAKERELVSILKVQSTW